MARKRKVDDLGGRHVRMNISVPEPLRDRMKAFDEEANWSRIAALAFLAYVEGKEEPEGQQYELYAGG